MIDVLISGTRPRVLPEAAIKRTVAESFRGAKRAPSGSLTVRFVDTKEITRLNRIYRKKNKATDVLSFAATEAEMPMAATREKEWGDIFVCSSYARTEAKRRSLPFQEELVRLISHGVLHLLGYDHATEKEEFHMFSIQEAVVERIAA